MRTAAERKTWELRCYGTTTDAMRARMADYKTDGSGPHMLAMSELSNAQEEIERGLGERARQSINRAKWIMSTYLVTGTPHAGSR